MLIIGENINLGIGVESVRGTPVAPEAFIPARVPTSVRVVKEKTMIKETKGTKVSSQGSVITQSRVEGDLEFNIKNGSFAYLLKSLLGKVTTTTVETGVYNHKIEIDPNTVQNPSLTLAIAQEGLQDYQIPNAVVSNLEVSVPMDDLPYATVSFIGQKENEVSDYTPAFLAEDNNFNHYDVTVKIADTVGDLDEASGKCIQELGLTIANNARVRNCLSSVNPVDVLALLFDIQGTMVVDYEDSVFHDLYDSGAYRAIEVSMVRSDVLIGATANPKITFTYPKVSIESYDRDLPIDDIVKENITFQAHYDDTEGKAIEINIVNEIATL